MFRTKKVPQMRQSSPQHHLRPLLFGLLALFAGMVYAEDLSKSLTMSVQPPYRYDFQLIKGKGTAVCDAYLQRLRNTDFYRIPQCDRPENASVPGFKLLNRVPLSRNETLALYDSVQGLLFSNDPGFAKLRAAYASRGQKYPDRDAQSAATDQEAMAPGGEYPSTGKPPPRYFRFEPEVDIDNDGMMDSVIVWKDSNQCGVTYAPYYDYPRTQATFLALLDAHGQLDVERTRALLQHPKGDTYSPPRRLASPVNYPFRKIGYTFGVFSFNEKYYMDTFYPSTGDLEDQPVRSSETTGVLAVLHRRAGITTAVCEIRWNDRPQRKLP